MPLSPTVDVCIHGLTTLGAKGVLLPGCVTTNPSTTPWICTWDAGESEMPVGNKGPKVAEYSTPWWSVKERGTVVGVLSTKTVAVVGKGVPAVTQAACTKMIHVAVMAGRGGTECLVHEALYFFQVAGPAYWRTPARVHRKLWVGKANGHSVSLSAGPRPDLLWQREKVMVDGLLRMWSTDGSGLLHALPAVLAFWVQQSAVGVATYSASIGLAPQNRLALQLLMHLAQLTGHSPGTDVVAVHALQDTFAGTGSGAAGGTVGEADIVDCDTRLQRLKKVVDKAVGQQWVHPGNFVCSV
jgi:hypothetical protein